MTRTYRELIADSLDPIIHEAVEIDGEIVQPEFEMMAFPFTDFIRSMVGIMILQADYICRQDLGQIYKGDELAYDGSAIENPTAVDLVQHCIMPNLGKSTTFHLALYRFLSWLLDETYGQNEEDDWERWCDITVIQGKWNEFIDRE